MFERAFKCNSVNFKAIFSIAMHALQNGRYDEAEIWLKNILCILQFDLDNNAVCEGNLKLLRPKELIYAKNVMPIYIRFPVAKRMAMLCTTRR